MTDEQRAVWRRRLLRAGVVPLLVALLFAVKVGVMLHADSSGRASYTKGDFESSRSAFGRNLIANVLEPWVADYDLGTARYRLGDLDGAVDSLRDALETVPEAEECRVRINLALAHERIGDGLADEDPNAAARQFRLGTEALRDGDCLEPDEESQRDAEPSEGPTTLTDDDESDDDRPRGDVEPRTRTARAVADRLLEKEDEAAQADPPSDEDARRAEELERRNDQGERQRREQEQRRRDREDRQDQGEPDDPTTPPTYEW